MPPTPFAPSHSTPFKSTLSTSMSGRRSSLPPGSDASSTWPPSHISLGSLDAREWAYLAEGGKNLLVRYVGSAKAPFVAPNGARLALRLTKKSRSANQIASEEEEEEELIDSWAWREKIIKPLLGPALSEALPLAAIVPLASNETQPERDEAKKFLALLSASIEMARPKARRVADGIDEDAAMATAVEDLTAGLGQGENENQSDGAVMAVEIKPKWGALPSDTHLSADTTAWKTSHSRYKMHRVHKALHAGLDIDRQAFADLYDPLDLYAANEESLYRLAKEWRWGEQNGKEERGKKVNNLKFFLRGRELDTSKESDLIEWQQYVSQPILKSTSDLSTSSIYTAVQRALSPALFPNSQLCAPLSRLRFLQSKLDALDVEGLANWWRLQTGAPFGEAGRNPELLAEPTLEEYEAFVADFLSSEQEGAEATLTLRQATLAFLLSASFKDCSLIVRCIPKSKGAKDEEVGREFEFTLKLIDLDPKPIDRLGHYEKLDGDIVKSFAGWAEKAGVKPQP